jgi:hypothetical protein
MMTDVPQRLKPKTPTYRLISPVTIWRFYQERSYGRVPLLLLALTTPSDRSLTDHESIGKAP